MSGLVRGQSYEQSAIASDDGPLSACSDNDRISLPAFLPTSKAQTVAYISRGMWDLEFSNRGHYRAPNDMYRAGRRLAPSIARRRTIFGIKAYDLGRLYQSVGRSVGPLACIRKQHRKNAESPFFGSRVDCLHRVHCHRLLRRRECISLRYRRMGNATLVWPLIFTCVRGDYIALYTLSSEGKAGFSLTSTSTSRTAVRGERKVD
jgi:hypothetical protein